MFRDVNENPTERSVGLVGKDFCCLKFGMNFIVDSLAGQLISPLHTDHAHEAGSAYQRKREIDRFPLVSGQERVVVLAHQFGDGAVHRLCLRRVCRHMMRARRGNLNARFASQQLSRISGDGRARGGALQLPLNRPLHLILPGLVQVLCTGCRRWGQQRVYFSLT